MPTTITVPPAMTSPAPSRSSGETIFAPAADVFAAEFTAFANAMRTAVGQMNTLAGELYAMGLTALSMTFDTTTADADPAGPGKLRLDNATQNIAATVRMDNTDAGGGDIAAYLASFGTSTSGVKGLLRIAHRDTPLTKWLLFNVTAVASPSGYKNITAACVGSSAASPFANGDPLVVTWQRTADAVNALTSGEITANSAGATSIPITGIPAAATRLVVSWGAISLSGSSIPMLEMGNSASGYLTGAAFTGVAEGGGLTAAGTVTIASDIRLVPNTASGGAVGIYYGTITFERIAGGTSWVYSGMCAYDGSPSDTVVMISGKKDNITGGCDRIRLISANGTDTTDGGVLSVKWFV